MIKSMHVHNTWTYTYIPQNTTTKICISKKYAYTDQVPIQRSTYAYKIFIQTHLWSFLHLHRYVDVLFVTPPYKTFPCLNCSIITKPSLHVGMYPTVSPYFMVYMLKEHTAIWGCFPLRKMDSLVLGSRRVAHCAAWAFIYRWGQGILIIYSSFHEKREKSCILKDTNAACRVLGWSDGNCAWMT